MRSFATIDSFAVTNRGTGHVVRTDREELERDMIAELAGSTVMLDGAERRVVVVESWLVPGRTVRAGDPICIVVADREAPVTPA